MPEPNAHDAPPSAPFMMDFYEKYYAAMAHSRAHHEFCQRVFGRDLHQHGFADLEQLQLLMDVTHMDPADRVLDMGCGTGLIAEYLSDCTGAHITGLDYIAAAICTAQERTVAKSDRLAFVVGDINRLELRDAAFDIILSIDTMYFSDDYTATIRALKQALRPGGQMAILYSYGREPWVAVEDFLTDKLPPDKTPLADALRANGLSFQARDMTRQDYILAQRRKAVLAELRTQFEAEGVLFIYENRAAESGGVIQAVEEGLHARYLYHVLAP